MNEPTYPNNEDLILETETEEMPKSPRVGVWYWLLGLLTFTFTLVVFCSWLYSFIQTPPKDFPLNTPITIELGTGTKQALNELKAAGYIRSTLALYMSLRLEHEDKTIKAGTYSFSEPQDVRALATILTEGNPLDNITRLTLIEGETVAQIATRAEASLPNFDTATFRELASGDEGKMFPETYLVPADYTAEQLYTLLRETFNETVADLEARITASTLTLDEIIILASILEREANTEESMRMVSGILQNRLKIGMALQVDASMEYVLDKPLSELAPEDLEIDSPYNTYLYPGLPPTPIGNPGRDAIEAVLSPTPSNYMFYITGNDGEFYYAEDFDGHRANIARYLR